MPHPNQNHYQPGRLTNDVKSKGVCTYIVKKMSTGRMKLQEQNSSGDDNTATNGMHPSGRTSRRKWVKYGPVLLCTTVFLFLALILFIGLFAWQSWRASELEDKSVDNYCITESCIRLSASMASNMDVNVDPCDNFYDYACGGWLANTVIPDDKTSLSAFSEARERLKIDIVSILEDHVDGQTRYLDVAQTLYRTCMDIDAIEQLDDKPLLDFIDSNGAWPMLLSDDQAWDADNWDLNLALSKMGTVYIDAAVSVDVKNNTYYVIYLDQTSLVLSRDYYFNDDTQVYVDAWIDLLAQVGSMLTGHNTTQPKMRRRAIEIVAFETKLANLTIPEEELRDIEASYNKMTIGELKERIPSQIDDFDWLEFLNHKFESAGIVLTDDEEIVITVPVYLERLMSLFKEMENDKELLADYLYARTYTQNINSLSVRYQAVYDKYREVIYGVNSQSARWESCCVYVDTELSFVLGAEYVKRFYSQEGQATAVDMIKQIRTSFSNILDDVDWMDAETKLNAKMKADSIVNYIGYPEWILNEKDIEEYYVKLSFPDGYFAGIIYSVGYWKQRLFQRLRERYNSTVWASNPAVVNAFYNRIDNAIIFPAGILQPPFYYQGYPKSANFGGIGAVIGHEITHGFDDGGRQYNYKGVLTNWWTNSSLENFNERAQCIVDQYSKYEIDEIGANVNGINTQGENIADNGGVKESYYAYQQWIATARHGRQEPTLPGLKLSNNQIFFLSFAQIWCNKARPASVREALNTAAHSPGKFRVIGTLSNSPEFAEAFTCPTGSKMNPEKKCYVW